MEFPENDNILCIPQTPNKPTLPSGTAEAQRPEGGKEVNVSTGPTAPGVVFLLEPGATGPGWPWESCALQTRGEAIQGLGFRLAGCIVQAQIWNRGWVDMWKHLGVREIGLCRMKNLEGLGAPGALTPVASFYRW